MILDWDIELQFRKIISQPIRETVICFFIENFVNNGIELMIDKIKRENVLVVPFDIFHYQWEFFASVHNTIDSIKHRLTIFIVRQYNSEYIIINCKIL